MASRAVEPASAGGPPARTRYYYLDWLRVIALLVLLVYHVNLIFDPAVEWQIESAAQWPLLAPLDAFLSQWRLPLLFLVSGVSTYFALGYRSAPVYLRDRFFRLVVPLVFGVLLVVPPQIYIERLTGIAPGGASLPPSLLGFYYAFWVEQFQSGAFYVEHLWFLRNLFFYSLAALPIFFWLRARHNRRIDRFVDSLAQGPWILLLALPIALFAITTAFVLPLVPGVPPSVAAALGERVRYAEYFVFFVYGYVIASSRALNEAMLRKRLLSLALAAGVLAFGLLARLPDKSLAAQLLSSVQSWLWVAALLGYAQVYLTRPSAFLRYATRVVLPFYVLHQTVIVLVAYLVLGWPLFPPLQYAAIILGSFGVTALLCELVRRFAVTRLFFGLRPRRSGDPSSSGRAARKRLGDSTGWLEVRRAKPSHQLLRGPQDTAPPSAGSGEES